jgi:putative ABC transport system ATP-binding protein
MSAPLVQVTDVHKTFAHGEVNALRGVSMRIEPGEFVAIKGASGSGKSTLLHLLAALDVADRGEIVVAGTNLRQLPNPNRYRRETIGLVFQLHALLPHLDAQQNVEIPMFGTARSLRERRAAAIELLAAVGLGRKEHRRPPEMSGGERQRVAVARALANDPLVLLADEPTGSLDPEAVATVLALFRRIREERGVTIVMVTHDAVVAGVADRTVTMSAGVIADSE